MIGLSKIIRLDVFGMTIVKLLAKSLLYNHRDFLLRKVKSDLILTRFSEKVRILAISEKSDLATHP